MPKAFPRSVILALLLMPLLWVAMDWSAFRTLIEIESNTEVLRISVNGQKLEVPTKLTDVRSLSVEGAPSFFTLGGESLVFTPAGDAPVTLPIPKRFVYSKNPTTALTGDWWDDRRAQQSEVFRAPVNAPAGFKMTAVFTGRTNSNIEIRFHGAPQTNFWFRAGTLSNDFGVAVNDRVVKSRMISAHPALDARHIIYPFSAGLFAACVLVIVFGLLGRFWQRDFAFINRAFPAGKLVTLMLIAGTGLSIWVAYVVLDASPHFQDDLGYLLRAKWLLAGHLALPIPENPEHFRIPFTFFVNNQWISQYTLGWPALLAIGEALRAPWLIAPLCNLALGFAIWKLGSACGGRKVGFAAATLAMLSPLTLTLGGSMLSHAAEAMWLTLFVWLYVTGWRAEKRLWLRLGIAGLALGFAFATRPLTAVAVVIPAAIYGVAELTRLRFGKHALLGLGALVLSGVLGALPQLIDNAIVTGDPLLFAYKLCKGEGWTLNDYTFGFHIADHTLATVPGAVVGWGWPWVAGEAAVLALAFGFASVPFITGRATRTDWLLLGLFLIVPLAYMGFNGGTPLHGFGPRYYADVFFALFILIARGFAVLAAFGRPRGLTRALAAGLFFALCISTAIFLPSRLKLAGDYNDIDNRIDVLLAKAHVTRGLILLNDPVYLMWIRAGPRLSANPRADLVFAEQTPDIGGLLKTYADYPVYLMHDNDMEPYQPVAAEVNLPAPTTDTR